MADVNAAPPGSSPSPGDADRLEALEQQVRQLTSRLAGWVEAQLVQALDDRRSDMKALRSEMQVLLNEQLAGVRGAGGTSSAGVERLEALEQRVRAAMSRLSDSVEARLGEVDHERKSELDGLRRELRTVVDERVGQPASAASVTAVQDRLAALSTSLSQRLDEIGRQAAAAADRAASLSADVEAGPARVDAFEQRVKAAMARLTDSVETRLVEAISTRAAELEALRSELGNRVDALQRTGATVSERLEALAQRTAAVGDDIGALQADAKAVTGRSDELEKRVKAAVARLAESVETRLVELTTERATEMETSATALRARIAQVQERIDTVAEDQREAGDRVGELVEAKLAEVVDQRRAQLEAMRGELEEMLAAQLREARSEIGVAVADAHRRFVVSVDLLEERMHTVAEQSTAAWTAVAGMETLQETVTSDGRRIEALETHTRRTDARLGELVEAKLAEQGGHGGTQLEDIRDELRAAVDKVQEQVSVTLAGLPAQVGAAAAGVGDQMRSALDAHLAETRAEVTLALGEGRAELEAGAAQLDALQTAFDQQAAKTVASLDALSTSVEATLWDAEVRLGQTVHAKVADAEAIAAQVAIDRAEVDAAVASLTRRVAKAQEQLLKRMDAVTEQVERLTRAATAEAGSLAPLRSDLRLLRGQVQELTEVVDELRPKRKAPAAPAKRPSAVARKLAAAAPAQKMAAAPAQKVAAVPAKKATAAPAKKTTAAPAKKTTAAPAKRTTAAPAKKAPAKKALRRKTQ
ncbi:MAG TPA: hypothetical protein VGV86_01945 [Acidimicrobiales bacterium]|nr:hypothetical protein [Acidimicrobiales bacterium]